MNGPRGITNHPRWKRLAIVTLLRKSPRLFPQTLLLSVLVLFDHSLFRNFLLRSKFSNVLSDFHRAKVRAACGTSAFVKTTA